MGPQRIWQAWRSSRRSTDVAPGRETRQLWRRRKTREEREEISEGRREISVSDWSAMILSFDEEDDKEEQIGVAAEVEVVDEEEVEDEVGSGGGMVG